MDVTFLISPLFIGWLLDQIFGDPDKLPHPIVWFGKVISWGEKKYNKGKNRVLKGAIFAILLIVCIYLITFYLENTFYKLNSIIGVIFSSIIVFYCLASKTLRKEVKAVFDAVEASEERGRKQVARIVGRDTSHLSAQEIKTAALETLSENLSDGVVAPIFWYVLLGTPGMITYKMINTLDSMIGYRNERYHHFGRWAAKIDDIANYLPARITAYLMIIASGKFSLFSFVHKYGKMHSSPNAGYPEAALAGILNCRFGGAHIYHGELVEKPIIGDTNRELNYDDLKKALIINQRVEIIVLLFAMVVLLSFFYIQNEIISL